MNHVNSLVDVFLGEISCYCDAFMMMRAMDCLTKQPTPVDSGVSSNEQQWYCSLLDTPGWSGA